MAGKPQTEGDRAAGTAELQANLALIDMCCEELSAAVESLIWSLTSYLREQLAELHSLKAALSADIADSVAEALTDGGQPRTKYSASLREFHPGDLTLFKYKVDRRRVEECLPLLARFELLDPPQMRRPQLVHLSKDQAQTYDFQADKWSPAVRLGRPVPVDESTRYAVINATQAFCCGYDTNEAIEYRKAVHLINFATGAVEDLPQLRVARTAPGVLHYSGALFVFGGKRHTDRPRKHETEWPDGKEVESLALASPAWSRLPPMTLPRWQFTPSVYKDRAYLFAANNAVIDVLDLSFLEYLSPIAARVPRDSLTKGAVSVVVDDELVIITISHYTVLDLVSLDLTTDEHVAINIDPVTSPVVCGGLLYVADFKGHLTKMRMKVTQH